jgi:hypothetical protein
MAQADAKWHSTINSSSSTIKPLFPPLGLDTSREVILEALVAMVKDLHTSKSIDKVALEAVVSLQGEHRPRGEENEETWRCWVGQLQLEKDNTMVETRSSMGRQRTQKTSSLKIESSN